MMKGKQIKWLKGITDLNINTLSCNKHKCFGILFSKFIKVQGKKYIVTKSSFIGNKVKNNCSFTLDVFPVALREEIEENDQIIPLSLQIVVFNLKKKRWLHDVPVHV